MRQIDFSQMLLITDWLRYWWLYEMFHPDPNNDTKVVKERQEQ